MVSISPGGAGAEQQVLHRLAEAAFVGRGLPAGAGVRAWPGRRFAARLAGAPGQHFGGRFAVDGLVVRLPTGLPARTWRARHR
jgi:hypothetical protein